MWSRRELKRTRIGHGRVEVSQGTQRRAQRLERGSNMVAVLEDPLVVGCEGGSAIGGGEGTKLTAGVPG